MSDFFQGWRRKAGCITLVMAFVFMLGLMRSYTIEDFISFNSGPDSQDGLLISDHRILWGRWHWEGHVPNRIGPSIQWSTNQYSIQPLMFFHRLRAKWYWRMCGLEYAGFVDRFDTDSQAVDWTMWAISYWSIITPLTLLSAYLILSNPRKGIAASSKIRTRSASQ